MYGHHNAILIHAVNVRGSFLMTKYSLLEMKKNNYGRILLIAQLMERRCMLEVIAGLELTVVLLHDMTGIPGICAYSCSKAAVIGLAKATGKEYAETGITVNALAPGLIKTEMSLALGADIIEFVIQKHSMKRHVYRGTCVSPQRNIMCMGEEDSGAWQQKRRGAWQQRKGEDLGAWGN